MSKIDLDGYENLLLSREGPVLNVTFNRPEKMNPISGTISLELVRLLRNLWSDEETRVVILTGGGKAFSAGGDLDVMVENLDFPERFIDAVGEVKDLVHAMIDCPKPLLGKINGPAIGLGATAALFCDITFAAENAMISDPHIIHGLVPGDGGAIIWPLLIGLSRAKQYLFTGEAMTGAEAARIGLVNQAVPKHELDAKVLEFANKLADQPPRILHFTKMAMNVALKREVSSLLDTAFAYEVISAYTRDHVEAVNAYMGRRKPTFTGQ
jgi:enoyl-CoA hydratase